MAGETSTQSGSDPGVVTRVSTFLAYFRWLFMPLGLLALIAVGGHAAADSLNDALLWAVDRVASWIEPLLAHLGSAGESAEGIALGYRATVVRSLALIWELGVDVLLALPALRYEEHEAVSSRGARARELWSQARAHPSIELFYVPLAVLGIVLAGGSAVARMVQGAVYLSLRQSVGDTVAGPVARAFALGVLTLVLFSLGARAVVRHAADSVRELPRARGWRRRWGWRVARAALILPLAWTAWRGAPTLLSFIR